MTETKNPIAAISDKYRSIVPSPAASAALMFAVGLPITYAGRRAVFGGLKNLSEDPRFASLIGVPSEELIAQLDLTLNSKMGKHGIPILLAATPALSHLFLNTDVRKPYLGLNKWPNMVKKESISPISGYQPLLDFGKSINTLDAVTMMQKNPFLSSDSYAKNLGTSIITAAPSYNNQTSLGNIFDSAVDKFDTKMKFDSFGSKLTNSAISGTMAGIFTDIVGAAIGTPLPLRSRLAMDVGVGKALYDILT